jgi:pimeloyl-ACP methyl ester carboxylesterase
VVVAHSLGAAYAPLVPSRLAVYLCPAPTGPFEGAGAGIRPIRKGFPFPPNDADGVSVWDPEAAIEAMYPRLPRPLGESHAAGLHPGVSASGPYPSDGLRKVPAALIYATEDEFFEPEWERAIARDVLNVEPIEIPGGHFPMLQDPDRLAAVLDGLARGQALRR